MSDKASSPFRIRDRLSYKQAKFTVIVAILLGVVFSFFQIYRDYHDQNLQLEKTVHQVLHIVEQSASKAAYSLDREYASELIRGLFAYKPVFEASIADNLGQTLSRIEGGKENGLLRPVTDRIFGTDRTFDTPLSLLPLTDSLDERGKMIQVGKLAVTIDTYPIGVLFIERSLFVFVSEILRNLILSLILLVFFHYFFTKPLLSVEKNLLKINPQKPERIRLSFPKGHTKDELARMVVATNSLLRTIQQNVKYRIQQTADSERMQGELDERNRRQQELEHIKDQLEQTNLELTFALEDVKAAQSRLVQSERMAALGEVTASLAHELNTPLGLGVSGASHLTDELNKFKTLYQKQEISKTDFEEFLEVGLEIADVITSNLRKSYQLIKSFKQVAVDQVSEARRIFPVKNYTAQVLQSMGNILNKAGHNLIIECDDNLEIDGYPGAFSQIISNLILNSIMHAFEQGEKGEIKLQFRQEGEQVLFTYSDNGKGIPAENKQKIYEPFFTTNPGKGGTGLGMHIIYNVVIQQFKGSIECVSEEGQGTTFIIRLLKTVPQ